MKPVPDLMVNLATPGRHSVSLIDSYPPLRGVP